MRAAKKGLWAFQLMSCVCLGACGGQKAPASAPKAAVVLGSIPEWVSEICLTGDKVCGLGVAGAGFMDSPYPKKLAQERAVRNLAGYLGTRMQEVIVDYSDSTGTSVDLARNLHIDDAFIEEVAANAKFEFWLDANGDGPFVQKGFTYAHACMDAKAAATAAKVDTSVLQKAAGTRRLAPDEVPAWIAKNGKQAGNRVCAVGFSLPMFDADKTFDGVVDDVRGQLAEVIETLVASAYQELTSTREQTVQAMTVASTDAISKGVIVTDFWYDRDGIGPQKQRRSTYGWGCVYPMDLIRNAAAKVAEAAPEDEKAKIAAVRERAEHAFADLEAEEAKQAAKKDKSEAASRSNAPQDITGR